MPTTSTRIFDRKDTAHAPRSDTPINWRQPVIEALLAFSRSGTSARLREYRELERRASPAEVSEYQRCKLLALLRHCHARVPWYRQQIEAANLDLSDGFSIDELRKLPILTKETIRDAGRWLLSSDRSDRGAFENSSGGSTGSPLVFLQDREFYASSVVAAKFLYNEFLGKKPGDMEINLWGSPRDVQRGTLGLRERAVNFLYNRHFQNSFHVDDAKLERFVDEINRHRPVSIWAYVESLDLLAKYIRRNKVAVYSPSFIISTAGTLLPGIRRTVETVFRCPLYNQYGSRELGAIAFEMQDQDGMRGLPYLNYTEVVDGKVIVTSLTNYSMPFVRYEIGDTADPWTGSQDPEYGCRRKVFKTITGRVHSHFKTPEGGLVHGLFFTHQFYFRKWVTHFQIVQDRLNHVTCYVVAAGDPGKNELEDIRSSIRQVMGRRCGVDFCFTDRIAPSASGKHLYTICKV